MNRWHSWLVLGTVATGSLLSSCGGGGGNQGGSAADGAGATSSESFEAPRKATIAGVRVAAPAGLTLDKIDGRLKRASGPVDIWVTLDADSLAAGQAALAASAGIDRPKALSVSAAAATVRQQLAAHRQQVLAQQADVSRALAGLGAAELGRVQVAHNAIAIRVDASRLEQVAALPGVRAVRPVIQYKLALSETVPYVGASEVQADGVDGTGVTVAVLDSGTDYTHRNLGGPGTLEAYTAAYGASPDDPRNTTLDGLFPTSKVVNGYDFVGETWGVEDGVEFGVRSEDPDPIDYEGHGTAVSDIIAGKTQDGTHVGVAPGAKLVAVRVCSAVSTACNGVALLRGVDFALDPDGDGDLADAVDVINLSLGADYGQVEDDLSEATGDAVRLGVMVVASAGNGGNRPYIVGSPSTAPSVLSVAQTHVPSATGIPLVVNTPATIAGVYGNTQTVEWAPIGAGVTGNVTHVGRGCPAGSIDGANPDDPYLDDPAGKMALIDRGACAVSLKVDRAARAGATGVLIGLVAPGDAISFSFGGGDTFVPTLVIQQVLSEAIKDELASGGTVNVSISAAAGIPLVGSMASSSSRGPAYSSQGIKPEIGAPGASVAAVVGTGSEEAPFGGTSGAAPMVSGAAALLLQAFPERSPGEIKAMLMNSAATTVYTSPPLAPGELAPITRIGAGELRVNHAKALGAIAWDRAAKSAALSFGTVDVPTSLSITKKLHIENFAKSTRTFSITPSFRYADDEASGAVTVQVPRAVSVGAGGQTDVNVTLVIRGNRLPTWTLNGGSQGGNGAALNGPEYDGYITLTAGDEKLSVPWHVLPRKASATIAGRVVKLKKSDGINLDNHGVESGDFDVFSLTGTSPRVPRSERPRPGDNFALVDLQSVGVRYLPAELFGDDYVEFAISTWTRRSHPSYPAEFDIYIDTTGDDSPDFAIFNADGAALGENLVFVYDFAAGTATPYFYADADLNSANMIMTVPMSVLGLQPGTTISYSVYAIDNYFTDFAVTDQIEGMYFTPGDARFEAVGEPFGSVPPRGRATMPVHVNRAADPISTESGFLLMYRRNAVIESEVVKVR